MKRYRIIDNHPYRRERCESERKLIHHERPEDIPLRHLHSIAWEYW